MPQGYITIPDWFSAENQGAGIAVANLAGQSHLVVMMVDGAFEQNRGLYRLGHDLADDGAVAGDWTGWIDIPGWFSWENQNADIAVADLVGDGGQDLVVMMIDNRPEGNQGFYRIGRRLQPDGSIADGWTGWIEVPDWFSWENQGAGIAVTPPDGQGRRNLVVLMIDAPAEQNRCVYRIGADIEPDGTVSGGWSDWIDVPGWFSWENQGAGVAVADIDGDGAHDLVVFQIDNAAATAMAGGQNQAFFRIGRNLDADGDVLEWGPDWLGIPHWFSWENASGGIAVAELGGKKKLFALMVDNPEGQNAGFYTTLDLVQDPAVYGKWEVQPFHSGVLAVHAALLPDGDALFFAGSGSSEVRFDSPDFGNVAKGVPVSTVWHPPGNDFSPPQTLFSDEDDRPFDLFCGGDAFLPDGRMLSAGGTQAYEPFKGRADVAVFDPKTRKWSFVKEMAHGRWYPSLITLGDGRILAATGLDENGGGASRTVMEIYDPKTDTWQVRHFAGGPGLPLYAHIFQLRDGRVFFSGGRMDDPLDVQPCLFDPTQEPVATEPVPDLLDPVLRNQAASVILPPAADQRVMVCGGGPVGKEDKTHATDKVSIVDLKAAHPVYTAGPPMGLGRMHLNLVLLPDHTVFVSGGSLMQESNPLSRLQAELYDPVTNAFRLMATATVPRLYHSTALLLADGRVVAAGGNPEGGQSVTFEPPDPDEEMRLEIFSPPYLFKGPRPTIGNAPARIGYNENVDIASPQAGGIRWASLLRNCVTTHSFDGSQRLIDLEITSQAGGTIKAKVTENPNIAPPGWYMLFLVDGNGVPSVARWVQLG